MSEGKPAQEFPDRTLPISSSTHHASEKTNGCGGRGRSSNAGPRGCKHGNDGVSSREESNWITWKLSAARPQIWPWHNDTSAAAWANPGRAPGRQQVRSEIVVVLFLGSLVSSRECFTSPEFRKRLLHTEFDGGGQAGRQAGVILGASSSSTHCSASNFKKPSQTDETAAGITAVRTPELHLLQSR